MHINPLFLCLLLFSFCIGIGYEVCLVFAVAMFHECGHILAAKLTKTTVLRVNIMPWGVCMETGPFQNERAECVTALAGPLTNLLLLGIQFVWQNEFFMLSNLFMLLINLLPVLPLDGGRVVRALLYEEVGKEKTASVMRVTAVFLAVFLFAAGVFLFYKTGVNFSVLMIAIFIACTAQEQVSPQIRERQKVRNAKHYAVSCRIQASAVLKMNTKTGEVLFDVLDDECGYMGTLTLRQVMEEIANCGYEINFAEILQKQLQNKAFCSTIDTV